MLVSIENNTISHLIILYDGLNHHLNILLPLEPSKLSLELFT